MTRIGIDPEAALQSVRHLDVVRAGLEGHSRFPGPGLLVLPPHVAAVVEFEVRRLRADLGRDSQEARRIQVALARTQLQFMLASGDGDASVLLALIGLAGFGNPAQLDDDMDALLRSDPMMMVGGFLGDFVDHVEEVDAFATISAYLGMAAWANLHGRNLSAPQFMKFWDGQRGMFGRGGAVGKIWGPFAKAVTLLDGYQSSSAVTPVGKAISSGLQLLDLKAWDRVAGGLPLGTALDTASGGILTGGIDAIVVLGESAVTLDSRGLEQFTDDALDGKKGWGIQAIAGVGTGISYIATGDVGEWQNGVRNGSYGPVLQAGQQMQDAAIDAAWDGTAAVADATSKWSPFW